LLELKYLINTVTYLEHLVQKKLKSNTLFDKDFKCVSCHDDDYEYNHLYADYCADKES